MTVVKSVIEPTAQLGSPRRSWRHLASSVAERYGLLVLFALMLIFFSTWNKTGSIFLSHGNIVSNVGSQMVLVVVGLAVMMPLTTGHFDLSAGATTGVSSVVCVTTMSRFHHSAALAVMFGIVAGLIVGAVNAMLIARFKLSAVITTLAMSTALTGLMQWYTGGSTISQGVSVKLQQFGTLSWFGIPRLVYAVLPLLLIVWYLLEWTPFGRRQQAISSNRRAATLVGVAVDRVVVTTFLLSGTLAGIAGVLLVTRLGAADSTTGPSYLFPALAAVFLGATVIRPGRPNSFGTVVGVFFVAFAVSGLTLAGAAAWVSNVFNGLVLFAAAAIATVFARQRGAARIL